MIDDLKGFWSAIQDDKWLKILFMIISALALLFLGYLWVKTFVFASKVSAVKPNLVNEDTMKKIIPRPTPPSIIGKNINTGTNTGIIGDVTINDDAVHLDEAIQDLTAMDEGGEIYTRAAEFLKNYFYTNEFRKFYLSDHQLSKLYKAFKFRPLLAYTLLPLLCSRVNSYANAYIKMLFTETLGTHDVELLETIAKYFLKFRTLKMFESQIAVYVSKNPLENGFTLINVVLAKSKSHFRFFFNSSVILEAIDSKTCALIIDGLKSHLWYFEIVLSSDLYRKSLQSI